MANITTLKRGGTGAGNMTKMDAPCVYVADMVIDFADALTAKGSALAAADTIEALNVPAGTVILHAGVQCIVPDNATTLTIDLGFTGGDVDEFVDGFDQAAAAAGAYSAYVAQDPLYQVPLTTADTIDVLFATLTGTLSTGKMRVWALLADVSQASTKPGIVQLGT